MGTERRTGAGSGSEAESVYIAEAKRTASI